LILLDVPALLPLSDLAYGLIDQTARGFAHSVPGAGDLPREPAHSGLETLAARGLCREAADAYRGHIAAHPADNLAPIKLAMLHRST
jgi:hypothetical protein